MDSRPQHSQHDPSDNHAAEQRFVEKFGLLFEESGLPPMAGRVYATLLMADPPHMSMMELAEATGASKSSVSSMTRLLIQIGLLEKLSLPGERPYFYRVREGGWTDLFARRMESITAVRTLVDTGLTLAEGKSQKNLDHLQEMHDLYTFFERELPALFERWEQQRKGSGTDNEHTDHASH